MASMADDDSKYRGKCILVLIIDTGLFIFDIARSAYSIILELVTTATGGSQKFPSHHLSSLYKHATSGPGSVSAATAAARREELRMSTTMKPSSINIKSLIQLSTTFATEVLNNSVVPSSTNQLDAINSTRSQRTLGQFKSSTGNSEITLNWDKKGSNNSTSEEENILIFGYVCTVVLLIVQIWALRTLWKAIKPENHPRLASKSCRKYCNYILFPRIPFVLFKWSIVGIIFALGENSVVAVFGLIYCIICYHCVNQLGKELIEISASSATRMSSIATTLTTTTTCQNNAFPNLHSMNPDAFSNLGLNNHHTSSSAVGVGMGGIGISGSATGDEDDEEIYRPPPHEIPKHERIGFKI